MAFGRTVWAAAEGRYDVIMECPRDEPASSAVPRDLLTLAMRVVTEILAERPAPLPGALEPIAREVAAARLGVSPPPWPRRPASAASRSGGPGDLSLLRLGYGCHRRLLWAALTGQTSAVGADIAWRQGPGQGLLATRIPVPAARSPGRRPAPGGPGHGCGRPW